MDLATLQSLAYIAQIVGVIGTLTVAFIGVRSYINSNKRAEEARGRELETRQAQLFMQIYAKWNEADFSDRWFDLWGMGVWSDYGKFKEGILDNPDKMKSLSVLIRFFEGLGVLVRENLLDIRLIALTMAGDTKFFWEQYKKIIVEWRRDWNYARMMDETEYLYNELSKYIEAHPELKT